MGNESPLRPHSNQSRSQHKHGFPLISFEHRLRGQPTGCILFLIGSRHFLVYPTPDLFCFGMQIARYVFLSKLVACFVLILVLRPFSYIFQGQG